MGNKRTEKGSRYEQRSVTRKVVKFYPGEADLLEHLESQPNEAGYIKRLIRLDLYGEPEELGEVRSLAFLGRAEEQPGKESEWDLPPQGI